MLLYSRTGLNLDGMRKPVILYVVCMVIEGWFVWVHCTYIYVCSNRMKLTGRLNFVFLLVLCIYVHYVFSLTLGTYH